MLLTNATLMALFRDYPDNAPVYLQFPIRDAELGITPMPVGLSQAAMAALRPDDPILIPVDDGRMGVMGILFREDGPVLFLAQTRDE